MELKIAKKIHIEIKETGTYALSLPNNNLQPAFKQTHLILNS